METLNIGAQGETNINDADFIATNVTIGGDSSNDATLNVFVNNIYAVDPADATKVTQGITNLTVNDGSAINISEGIQLGVKNATFNVGTIDLDAENAAETCEALKAESLTLNGHTSGLASIVDGTVETKGLTIGSDVKEIELKADVNQDAALVLSASDTAVNLGVVDLTVTDGALFVDSGATLDAQNATLTVDAADGTMTVDGTVNAKLANFATVDSDAGTAVRGADASVGKQLAGDGVLNLYTIDSTEISEADFLKLEDRVEDLRPLRNSLRKVFGALTGVNAIENQE